MRWLAGPRYPSDVADFRLMSAPVVEAFGRMREAHRFVRGMVAWLGFTQKAVVFDRDERAAGTTKYSTAKMLKFAWSAITSFSALPVRAGSAFGLLLLAAAFLYSLRVFYVRFVLQVAVPGWSSIVLLQLFFSGLTFFYLGVIGDYVGRIYEEGKHRPLYVVRTRRNVDAP
jgi:polyisoprenyl-phosphate glycosyltransferase